MNKNLLHQSLILALLVLGILILLSFINPVTIGTTKFRKIDLLADVRFDKSPELKEPDVLSDSITKVVESAASTCPPGIVCFEDYSPDSSGFRKFFDALKTVKTNKVRIAFYGDSFIEGDMFCGSLRDSLQNAFGGRGVGMLPITSEVAGFRTTVKHEFANWKTKSLVSKKDSTIRANVGPTGFVYLPQQDNFVLYKTSYQRLLRDFSEFYLYYKSEKPGSLEITFSDSTQLNPELKGDGSFETFSYRKAGLNSVKITFPPSDSIEVYGASLEGSTGIVLDNFYMRGNSGLSLTQIPDNLLTSFNKSRQYKLILLQYGLNVVNEDSMTYRGYANGMIKVVRKLKRLYPEASIVMLSVSDRATNTSGTFKSMPSIKGMRDAQRYVAMKTGIVFWDLFQAMGGEGGMVKFVNTKPAMAAKDYTHLTYKGGQKLSGAFVRSLLYQLKSNE